MTAREEVHTVKMAKASKEEFQALLDFFQNLEEMVDADPWNSEIGEYVVDKMRGDVGASYNRVLWGFDTLVTNVCDPELNYLELKPELRNLAEQREDQQRRKFMAMDMTDRALSMASRVIVERDAARSERDEARAVARRYYRRAGTFEDAARAVAADAHDATRLLRQLLHALDRQRDGDGDAHLSWRVCQEMAEARAYLQGEGDRED